MLQTKCLVYNKGGGFQQNRIKGVLHPWTLFSEKKSTLNKVSNGFDYKCSKDLELQNHIFISVETIVVKLL